MSIINCALSWLHDYKPLWDFLTAIGTVGAVVVSLYLASRQTKAHLTVSVEALQASEHSPMVAAWAIINDGKADQVVSRCYWRTHCIEPGRIYLLSGCELNGFGPRQLPLRISKEDQLTGRDPIDSIADLANKKIPETATLREIENCIRGSKFGCTTTTGNTYEIDLPEALQTALIARINLIRRPI